MSATEALGKVLSGKLIDALNWDVHTYNILSLLTMAVSITLLPLAKTTFHMFVFAVFYGFAVGVYAVCAIMITPKLVHPDDAKHAVSYLFGAMSIPGAAGPVLAGEIMDW
jgi:MFS family permease